jgi:hypothetical protein
MPSLEKFMVFIVGKRHNINCVMVIKAKHSKKKGLTVFVNPFDIFGGAGEDRTRGLLNAMLW